jgi:PleD family two-component response regulator
MGFTALRADDTPGGAFDRADNAVYFAKENGRNQVRWSRTRLTTRKRTSSSAAF